MPWPKGRSRRAIRDAIAAPVPAPAPAPAPSPEAAPAADDPFAVNERDALSTLMSELSGISNARVTVYRLSRNAPQAYMFACSPEAFSLDELRDKYNGGTFRIYITRNAVAWRNFTVAVEPRQAPPSEGAPPAGDLAAAMRDGFAMQAAALREALRPASAAPTHPLAGIDLPALITALTGAIAALRAPAPAPVIQAPAASSEQAITMLLKGIELAREFQASGEEPGMLSLARDFLRSPILQAAVSATQAPAAVPRPPVALPPSAPRTVAPPVTPAAPAAPAAPITHPAPAPGVLLGAADMNVYAALLAEKAASGADPTLYADLILDNVPESILEALLNRAPDPVSALLADYPVLAPHRAWIEQLVGAIVSAGSIDEDSDGVLEHAQQINASTDASMPFDSSDLHRPASGG